MAEPVLGVPGTGGITAPGTVIGSRPNMAPEHVINYRYIEPCTDVFEMAASFHHMLTSAFLTALKNAL